MGTPAPARGVATAPGLAAWAPSPHLFSPVGPTYPPNILGSKKVGPYVVSGLQEPLQLGFRQGLGALDDFRIRTNAQAGPPPQTWTEERRRPRRSAPACHEQSSTVESKDATVILRKVATRPNPHRDIFGVPPFHFGKLHAQLAEQLRTRGPGHLVHENPNGPRLTLEALRLERRGELVHALVEVIQ